MSEGKPEIIAIDHDDYHAKYVGRTSDGRQFFITTPFEFAIGDHPGSEYIALFLFDAGGALVDAKIDDLGPRADLDEDNRRTRYEARLKELGTVACGRIEVRPFAIEHNGTTFGLVAREPEDEDDFWAVEMQPGNYMAFFEPWDSGEYDT